MNNHTPTAPPKRENRIELQFTKQKTFETWKQAIAHATALEMRGEISRRELNDVKTAARQAGHKC